MICVSGTTERQDCRVRIDWSGPQSLEVRTKGEPLHGNSMRAQVLARAAELCLEGAKIEVDDQGALPFVLDARLEAAAHTERLSLPPMRPRAQHGMVRSRLYVPANAARMLPSVGVHGADVVILDLEDAVADDQKTDALALLRHALAWVDFWRSRVWVRVNPLTWREEWEQVRELGVDCLVLPKAEDPEWVAEVASMVHPSGVVPILESALALEAAFEIACCAPNVDALTLGGEDYAASMGLRREPMGEVERWALMRMANAARAADVSPLGPVLSGTSAPSAGFLSQVRSLGLEGVGCIHPGQVRAVHAAFAPSPEEVAWAQQIVKAMTDGGPVTSVAGQMVDKPVLEQARSVLERARESS